MQPSHHPKYTRGDFSNRIYTPYLTGTLIISLLQVKKLRSKVKWFIQATESELESEPPTPRQPSFHTTWNKHSSPTYWATGLSSIVNKNFTKSFTIFLFLFIIFLTLKKIYIPILMDLLISTSCNYFNCWCITYLHNGPLLSFSEWNILKPIQG